MTGEARADRELLAATGGESAVEVEPSRVGAIETVGSERAKDERGGATDPRKGPALPAAAKAAGARGHRRAG